MNALLLAGGKGKRLRPLTEHTPKVMIPLGEEPILERNLRILKKGGITEIFINLHYQPQAIQNYFQTGENWGVRIRYIHEKELSGTAGVLRQVMEHLSDPFIVYYGDNFIGLDLADMIRHHEKKSGLATIAVFDKISTPNSGVYGGSVDVDSDDRIRGFYEGAYGEHRFINAGVYVLRKDIVNNMPHQPVLDFGHDVFPHALKNQQPMYAYQIERFVFGLDTHKSYQKAVEHYERVIKKDFV